MHLEYSNTGPKRTINTKRKFFCTSYHFPALRYCSYQEENEEDEEGEEGEEEEEEEEEDEKACLIFKHSSL